MTINKIIVFVNATIMTQYRMSYDDYQMRLRAVYQTDSNTRLRVSDKSTTLLLIHRLLQFVHITKPSACDLVILVILVNSLVILVVCVLK